MKLLLPALIIFLLAFTGLAIGILFGRKGISGGCSSNEGKLADINCSCGRDMDSALSCENDIAVEVICPEQDPEKYQQMLDELQKRG
ncbi:MAG: hypothetical protein B6I37_02290 [Desulfobacteraceae bacterium 4572_35.2]|jgi:hypothetical protein|nr:MAG: hypothetical protein B6I37_02290 [Desulfobacteraceae bacterium 4572_35.2]